MPPSTVRYAKLKSIHDRPFESILTIFPPHFS